MLRLLILLALTSASLASADPDPQTLADARAHFQQGKAFLDAKVYDKAIDEFEAAYKLSPFPELVFNVAQAYRLGNQPDKAIAAYQEYLKSQPSGELADEARVHVAELTKLVDDRTAAQVADVQTKAAAAQAAVQHQQALADHDRAQQDYEHAKFHHDALAHNRHVGIGIVIASAVLTAGGLVLIIPDPASGPGAVGFIAAAFGVTGMLIGGGITASSNPGALPQPPPPIAAAHTIGYSFSF